MLEILRRNASSWMTKVILGLLSLVFIFFFGSTTMRSDRKASDTLVEVDGYPILESTLSGLLRQNKENNPAYKDLPKEYEDILRTQLLEQLINTYILSENAKKLGFRVTDAELATFIKENPNLQVDGKFNFDYYHNQFLPAIKQRYGIDFEKETRNNILIDKLRKSFREGIFVSTQMAETVFERENTRIKVEKIEINPFSINSDYTPSETEIEAELSKLDKTDMNDEELSNQKKMITAKLKEKDSLAKAEKIANDLWPLFKKGKLNKEKLEKNSLKKREIPFVDITQSSRIIPNLDDDKLISQLFSLTEKKPYPEKIIRNGNSFFLIKLIEKKVPDYKKFTEEKDQIIERLKTEIANQNFQFWFEAIKEKTQIDYMS